MLETQLRELAKQLPPEQQVNLAIELLLSQWDPGGNSPHEGRKTYAE